MPPLTTLSKAEQVASHLREGIRMGQWRDLMPGRDRLAAELGVSPTCVQRGLDILEREGLLVPQGGRKRRKIVLETGAFEPRAVRIGIVPFDPGSRKMAFMVDMQHQLIEAGHAVSVTTRTLTELGMKVPRIARMVRGHEVDAWIVVAATREVLEWFDGLPTPVFGLWGSHLNMSIAGTTPSKIPATNDALNRLISLGHRRIIYLVRPHHIKTPPIKALQAFIDVMKSHGIVVDRYHMPLWDDESPEGLHRCLDSLFATTPPTALIVDEPEIFLATKDHLAHQGIVAPEKVSLICTDPDRTFAWHRPEISHLAYRPEPMLRHIVRWASNLTRGKDDRRKTTVKAEFVEGGTIGPVPKGR